MILTPQPVNRELFITNNKDEMLKDIDILSYDEYIDKWSRNDKLKDAVRSRVFEKWVQSPDSTTKWKVSIKNAIILSSLGISNSHMSKLTGLHIGTIYRLKLGGLYFDNNTIDLLEKSLNIKLYRK